MAKVTINEGLVWMKTLRERQVELVSLRNENSNVKTRHYGMADNTTETKPTYDVKVLDKMITTVAKEIRLLDQAIKRTNASAEIMGYDQNDDALGELS